MVLVADAGLTAQLDRVIATASAVDLLLLAADTPPLDAAEAVTASVASHPEAVPVALGGGRIMDLVRLAALAAVDPTADGFGAAADGPTFLPTRRVNPTICIPSTLGTAAEVSAVAVRATPAGSALILSPGLRSSGAVFDPIITGTLPPQALAAGLVEPWARVCVPAVAGQPLLLQDELARALASVLLDLGDRIAVGEHGDSWRSAAALASAQTHLCFIALGRAPAGHALWPLATEVVRATGLTKATALAALVPAWLRCLATGDLSRTWGTVDRVRAILGAEPQEAADRVESWLQGLSLSTLLPGDTVIDQVVDRVLHPWQSSGLFLPGVAADEIAAVITRATSQSA
jgi:NADP-dependent alcohol dehydrogenase